MFDSQLAEAVRSAIQTAVAPTRVDAVEIAESKSFQAEDILYITVALPAGTGPLPAPNYMEMLRSVGHTLLKAGEERTPFFRTVREDDEEPLETTGGDWS